MSEPGWREQHEQSQQRMAAREAEHAAAIEAFNRHMDAIKNAFRWRANAMIAMMLLWLVGFISVTLWAWAHPPVCP